MSLALSPAPQPEAETVIAPTHADGIWSSRLADWLTHSLYWGVHAAALGVFFTGVTKTALVLFALTFWGRLFGITGGYHRYFSHRAYKTSRWFQFLLALGATCTAQKGVLWWAAHHRDHHKYSDTPEDIRTAASEEAQIWWAGNWRSCC